MSASDPFSTKSAITGHSGPCGIRTLATAKPRRGGLARGGFRAHLAGVTDRPLSIFLDTNAFIHLRDLKDLPWREVAAAEGDIELVVSSTVIEELDRFKVETNKRRRDRSRAALKLIEQASSSEAMTLVLRSSPQTIRLRIARDPLPDWEALRPLNPSKADDQIVACAATEPVTGDRLLLSFDTGPLIRARQIGLPARSAPQDWHLPDAADDSTGELARLRREVQTYRSNQPVLTATFDYVRDGGELPLLIPELPQLAPDLRRELLAEAIRREPEEDVRATDHLSPYRSALSSISVDAVQRYQSDYRKFRQRFAAYFEHLHETLQQAMQVLQVDFTVQNSSQVTAVRTIVRYSASRPSVLINRAKVLRAYEADGRPPRAPEPPKPLDVLSPAVFRPPRQEPRDPTRFYALEDPGEDLPGAWVCEELRPARSWKSRFWVIRPEDPVYDGRLTIELEATNLPEPVLLTTRVVAERRAATWGEPQVLARLPDWIAERVARG